jgi:exopolyphosphatase/guanosine-5'-triphosphate,3'-diphosphate pyrophosphatase
MDTKRVDLMPAAAVLVDSILTRVRTPSSWCAGGRSARACLLELARVNGPGAATRLGRHRAVAALAHRYAGDNAHGRQIATLATTLFDGLAPLLKLPASSRELLEYAALLHDIGHAVDHGRHQRHTYYLIKNSELLGFEPEEIEVIALVARGHRKTVPKPSAPELAAIPPAKRKIVRGPCRFVTSGGRTGPHPFRCG